MKPFLKINILLNISITQKLHNRILIWIHQHSQENHPLNNFQSKKGGFHLTNRSF